MDPQSAGQHWFVIRSNCSTLAPPLLGYSQRTSMRQRPDDGIQNLIEALANIFAQKPQHMISVLLQQNILAPVTSVRLGISQVLNTIQFDCYLGFCAQ